MALLYYICRKFADIVTFFDRFSVTVFNCEVEEMITFGTKLCFKLA